MAVISNAIWSVKNIRSQCVPGQTIIVGPLGAAILTALLLFAGTPLGAAPPEQKKAETPFPDFSEFSPSIEAHFSGLKKHRSGDILSQSDVKPVFRILKKMGWEVADRKKILKAVPADSEYLVKQLRTKKGRVFMRDLSKSPQTYDRLDRFLKLPNSKKFFQGLLDGPDGYKMFQYMTTSKGGEGLGRQLSNAKKGRNFNKPTGRIYTMKDILKRLKESHALHLKKLKEKQADEDK